MNNPTTSWNFWKQLKAIIPNLPMDNVKSATIDCHTDRPVVITTEQYAAENGQPIIKDDSVVMETKQYCLTEINDIDKDGSYALKHDEKVLEPNQVNITIDTNVENKPAWLLNVDLMAALAKREIADMYHKALASHGIYVVH